MRYYNEIKPEGKKTAYIAVAIYIVALFASIFLVRFSFDNKMLQKIPQEAILITIGDVGKKQTSGRQSSSLANANKGKITSGAAINKNKAPENDNAKDAIIESPAAKTPATVNARALYKAKSGSQTPSSNKKQTPGTSTSGSSSYDGYDNQISLEGRNIIGSLPRPEYISNSQGSVVIEIHVNQLGKVTHTAFMAKGSTTNDSKLIEEALKAAKKATFNVDYQSSVIQSGTITYVFNIR